MSGQSDAAAERSFHVPPDEPARCFVCGGPWSRGGASYAAGTVSGHGLVEVCSRPCAEDPRFTGRGRAREPWGWAELQNVR